MRILAGVISASLPGITAVPTLAEAVRDADCLLLLVHHREFAGLNPAEVAALTPARLVIDTRNQLNVPAWQAVGFKLVRLGVGQKA